jgi:hypothetical protein
MLSKYKKIKNPSIFLAFKIIFITFLLLSSGLISKVQQFPCKFQAFTFGNKITSNLGLIPNLSLQPNLVVMTVVLWCLVVGVSDSLDMCLEAVVLVRGVFDDSLRAIGLIQGVFALNLVAITVLPLALVVLGVRVMHAILELVRRVMVVVDMVVLLVVVVVAVVVVVLAVVVVSTVVVMGRRCMMMHDRMVHVVHFDLVGVAVVVVGQCGCDNCKENDC